MPNMHSAKLQKVKISATSPKQVAGLNLQGNNLSILHKFVDV